MRAGLIIGAALVAAGVCASAPSFAATDATKEISAQRRARVVITPAQRSGYPGPYAKRECESLAPGREPAERPGVNAANALFLAIIATAEL